MRQFVRIIGNCLLVSMMLYSSVTWAKYNVSFPTTSWYSPTGKATLTTSKYYDYYSSLYSQPKPQGHGIEHAGVDVHANVDSSVYAIGNGTVLEVRKIDSYDKDYLNNNNSVITIEHKTNTGKRFCAIYGHVSSSLAKGKKVSKRDYIGQVKRAGNPDHIHFGINTSINSNVCQKADRWGTVNKGTNPGNYGFVDPFDWLRKNPATSSLSYIRISGSDTITENQCQYYTVYAYYTNGNFANVTDKVYWGDYSWLTVSNFSNNYGNPYAKVCASSVYRDSYTELTANYNESGVYKMTKLPITIKNSDSSSSNTTSIPTAVRYINQCIDKYSNYFGTKVGSAEVCFEDFYCQDTTGGTLGNVVKIAVHKSQRDVFWYFWGGWKSLDLSFCE